MKMRQSAIVAGLLLVMLGGALSARAWYDPGAQRWINRDPIKEWGDINLYRFVANEPVRKVDHNGHTWAAYPGVKNPTFPTPICKSGRLVPYVPRAFTAADLAALSSNTAQQQLCIRRCQRIHEESHIKDILAQNPDLCIGVDDGSVIVSGDPNTELLNSEQRAHQAEAGCLRNCAKKCPGAEVEDRQAKIADWIKKHRYE